jgi:YHS domain-containing protein
MKMLLSLVLIFVVGTATAQGTQLQKTGYNLNQQGIALDGYDLVAYFQGKPLKGLPSFSHTWQGTTFYFSSAQNLQSFKQHPDQYQVAYGGWCAYAMGESGDLVEVNPLAYKIIDQTVYLFYKTDLINTLKRWEKNESALKQSADANWAKRNP